MLTIFDPMEAYLNESRYIDWRDPDILALAAQLRQGDPVETVRSVYHFVRDEIRHSWDAQDRRVTAAASQVLREKTGICWAKANLLCALLRANGIPAGICYQRLTLGDTPKDGYCVHALNAVWVESLGRWICLDARGNKPGVDAQMRLDGEQLAFTVRTEMDEKDYQCVYAQPLPATMKVLEENSDALDMYLHHLPQSCEE